MSQGEQELLVEYQNRIDIYDRLADEAYKQILEIVEENNFFIMDVQKRTKDCISLKRKLEHKSEKYTSLDDITDLCGLRIICYFTDTVDEISRALSERFVLDEANSVDTRDRMLANQFGYVSLHRICSLPDREGVDEELKGIPFEVQIRTVLQHAWAEIEHDLGYKSEFEIPRAIRRNFSRVAGLLETADIQFTKIRDDSEQYNRTIHEKIRQNDCDAVLLDITSLRAYVNDNFMFKDILSGIKEALGVDIEYVDPFVYLKQLEWFELETLGELKEFINNNLEYATQQIKSLRDEYAMDIITMSILFKFLCEGELLRNSESDDRIRNFLAISLNGKD